MTTPVHEERLDAVVHHLLSSGARRVLDLGCGDGQLLLRLTAHNQFERLVGIDIDEHALAAARQVLGLAHFGTTGRTHVQHGSFLAADSALSGFDAATMVETIEHIDARQLSRLEAAVLGNLRPQTMLMTTPNQEYNVLHGLAPGEFRHPDHRFEWTRAKFRQWAHGAAQRNGYRVSFFDIGPPDPVHGSTTQMARFVIPSPASAGTPAPALSNVKAGAGHRVRAAA